MSTIQMILKRAFSVATAVVIAVSCFLTFISTAQTSSTTLNVAIGWNLLGNATSTPIAVSNTFGISNKIISVWKWDAATSTWAFYTPSNSDGGAAYASAQGYEFLTSINPGEGYWVNSSATLSIASASASAYSYTNFLTTSPTALLSGWNLISIGDAITPSVFNTGLSSTAPAVGSTANNFTSLWAWDSIKAKWYFYSPILDSSGTLASYITAQGYEDFIANNKNLQNGVGFWVNNPTKNLTAVKVSITGLASGGSITVLNGSQSQTIGYNGTLGFTVSVNSAYNITVGSQPTGQICTVTNASGNANTPVSNISINCSSGNNSSGTSTTTLSSSTTLSSTTTTTQSSSSNQTIINNNGHCSQLVGTQGNDIFYPIGGGCNQELTLSPGNDIFNLTSTNNQFQINPIIYTPTSGVSINLSGSTVTANNLQLQPYTFSNGFGGVDEIYFSSSPSDNMIYFWSGPNDDYLIKDSGTVFWDFTPQSGNDTLISKGGPLSIDLWNFSGNSFTIPGSTGMIKFDSKTSLNYSGVSGWSFYNGDYNVISNVTYGNFTFWNISQNNTNNVAAHKNQYFTSNGFNNNINIQSSNLILTINNFDTSDQIWPLLLQNYGHTNATADVIKAATTIKTDAISNTTTLTFTNMNTDVQDTKGVSSVIVNGIYPSFIITPQNSIKLVPAQ